MENLIGMDLGRYHILEQPGEGGMATVYKAFDTRLERDVAIKIIRKGLFGEDVLERMLKRFEREAKALARLTHPNIVGVIDYGDYKGSPFLVMEYLPGGTLKQKLGKPMPWQVAVRLLLPISQALEYAHAHGIIHRDIKPSNILLTERGQPMLSDFGIAKILDVEEGQTLTGTGVGVGTPEYMAPEQWIGRVTPQSDIYSLGVVFYEMVTGRKPYSAETPAAVLIKQTNDPLLPPRQFAPGLPEAVERVLIKALAKNPADRYPDMADFGQALEKLASGQPTPEQKALRVNTRPAPVPIKEALPVRIPPAESQETLPPDVTQDKQPPAGQNINLPPTTQIPNFRYSPYLRWLPWAGGTLMLALIVTLLIVFWNHGPVSLTPKKTFIPSGTFTPVNTATLANPLTATLGKLSTSLRPADGMIMLFVPAGEFTLGSEEGTGDSDEHPQQKVTLDAFWIDKTEVTNAMYTACVKAGACQPPQEARSFTRDSYYGNSEYDDYPVIFVNWYQAKTYCQWAGAELPTEVQWEKAARGTDARIYPWGNASPVKNLANFNNNVGDTTAVGSQAAGASPFGALDMAGNVWEWVNDWYDPGYWVKSPSSNPPGPPSGNARVFRGGSWDTNENYLRSANRDGDVPEDTNNQIGFRCSHSIKF
jgi:eukaryotic-like serine/threonine-protein kinase